MAQLIEYGEGMGASLVYDGGSVVYVPEEMGEPRNDQMAGTTGEQVSEVALRICYDSMATGRPTEGTISNILSTKHYSVFEHFNKVIELTFDPDTPAPTLLKVHNVLSNRKGLFYIWEGLHGTTPTEPKPLLKLRICSNIRAILEWDEVSDRLPGVVPDLASAFGSVLIDAWHREVPLLVPVGQSDVYDCMKRFRMTSATFVEPKYDHEKWVSLYLKGSRGWSHEQVRHRFAISQRSTRYCNESQSPWVLHPLIQKLIDTDPEETAQAVNSKKKKDEDPIEGKHVLQFLAGLSNTVESCRVAYTTLVSILGRVLRSQGCDSKTARKQARGAARGLLGNALQTEMIFSAPVVFWRHILEMRCANMSDAEIRLVYNYALPVLQTCRYGDRFAEFELEPAIDGIGFCLTGGGHL
jgi:thymidylate synthase ThyX